MAFDSSRPFPLIRNKTLNIAALLKKKSGEDEELELIDKKLNYIATITQDPAGEASTTVEYILKYLDGEKFDKIVPISAGIYCAEGQLTSEQVLGN